MPGLMSNALYCGCGFSCRVEAAMKPPGFHRRSLTPTHKTILIISCAHGKTGPLHAGLIFVGVRQTRTFDMNTKISIAVSAIILSVVACSNSPKKGTAQGDADRLQPDDFSTAPVVVGGIPERGDAVSGDLARIVYFDFDSATISRGDLDSIERWAHYLRSATSRKVRLVGHTDERGTRAYNVGLGERRAIAVREALQTRGVLLSQMSVDSFGEENPAQLGRDESAWAANRRVELHN